MTTARSDSLRHPLSLAGVRHHHSRAVGFVAMRLAALLGSLQQPVRRPRRLRRTAGDFRHRAPAHPRRRVAAAAGAASRSVGRQPDWPVVDLGKQRVAPHGLLLVTALTAVNIVIVLLAGYGTLHWMESPAFCGQVCHTPMHPQYTAWQNAPHSRVACTQCHIGEGARALVHYKLAGVRMLAHVHDRQLPAADSGVDCRPAPRDRNMRQLSHGHARPWPAIAHHPRIRRRRGQHGDDDRAADAGGRAGTANAGGTRDSLAR